MDESHHLSSQSDVRSDVQIWVSHPRITSTLPRFSGIPRGEIANGSHMPATWFLAQLKPNARKIAERNLHRQGFETFLPLIEQSRRKASAFVTETKPLFPGYIFVCFTPETRGWRGINATQGVTRLVSFGNAPAPVPDALIREIQRRCTQDGLFMPEQAAFNVGDTVTVGTGPFADFAATISELQPDQRVWVLIDLMGRKTRVSVNATDLKR